MITLNRTFQIARRTLAFSAVLGLGIAAAHAQQAVAPAVTAQPALNFQVPVDSANASFSSSAASNDVANSEVADTKAPIDFLTGTGTQPPPRGRYNRPRYRGGNTNADGSNKYGFLVGAGFTSPVGTDSNYLKTSWGFQIGGGRNWSQHFGVLAQFDWDNFGFTGQTISNQAYLYFDDPGNTQYGLDGNSHIWSLTLNPTYTFYSGEGLGAYIVGGGGFYHKEASFFVPEAVTECDEFGDCFEEAANQPVQNYSSNSPGVSGGFGLTHKMSQFSNGRLYGEVRIVHTFNNYRPGITAASSPTDIENYTGWNYFPQNSQETTYFPVKFGLRF